MMMKLASQGQRHNYADPRTTSVAGKLARTFTMQTDALARFKGRIGFSACLGG